MPPAAAATDDIMLMLVPSDEMGGPASPRAEALCKSNALPPSDSVVVPGRLLVLLLSPPEPLLLPLRLWSAPLSKLAAAACNSGERLFSLKQWSRWLPTLFPVWLANIDCIISVP